MSDLITALEQSDNYREVENNDPPRFVEGSNNREFQNILHSDSNTVFTVIITEFEEGENMTIATLYFEIDDTPYWIESYVDGLDDLRGFKRDAQQFMVDMLNRNEL